MLPACSRLLLAAAGVWQVGDYVLSPDIVVERKALADLFASLGSGRLYNQVRLQRLHSHPDELGPSQRVCFAASLSPFLTRGRAESGGLVGCGLDRDPRASPTT